MPKAHTVEDYQLFGSHKIELASGKGADGEVKKLLLKVSVTDADVDNVFFVVGGVDRDYRDVFATLTEAVNAYNDL